MTKGAKTMVACRLRQGQIHVTLRAETPPPELFDRNTRRRHETHNVGPNSKTAQRPGRRTKPPKYLNLVRIYSHLLFRFPQRSVQHRFITRIDLSAWET